MSLLVLFLISSVRVHEEEGRLAFWGRPRAGQQGGPEEGVAAHVTAGAVF